VQRWEEGKWLAFPVPARTDQSGQFTTYVEFGQPGLMSSLGSRGVYRLRVLDPGSGVTSKPFVLLIKGLTAFPLHCRSRRRSWASLSFAGRRMSLRGFRLNPLC